MSVLLPAMPTLPVAALAVHQVLDRCRALGVETASVFLMSDRNFARSEAEVEALAVHAAQRRTFGH